jgi:hypothetical protein
MSTGPFNWCLPLANLIQSSIFFLSLNLLIGWQLSISIRKQGCGKTSTTILKASCQKHRSWQLYSNEKNGLQQIQMESCQPFKPAHYIPCHFLTLYLLKCRMWWAPNNASKWQMGFNWAFKGLKIHFSIILQFKHRSCLISGIFPSIIKKN